MRTERQRRAVAYHEAGHAVMRLELGRRLVRVTITPQGDSEGHVAHRATKLKVDQFDDKDWRLARWAQTEIMTCLAGPEAERRISGRRNNAGAENDYRHVADVALRAEGEGKQVDAYIRWLELKVEQWVASPGFWRMVEVVAATLLERETLSGDEVRATCIRAFEGRW